MYLHYEGESLLGDSTIRSVVTGIDSVSRNRKTGDVIQQYVVVAGTRVQAATKTGEDRSICGQCPHRPINNGTCYVLPFQIPNAYAMSGDIPALEYRRLKGRVLRLGAYGDPTAVPFEHYEQLLSRVDTVIGYTHQWRTCDERWKAHLMASVDTPEEADDAERLGWRTYRIRLASEHLRVNETQCLYESRSIPCSVCRKCNGTSGKSKSNIAVTMHGANFKIARYAKTRDADYLVGRSQWLL